MTDPPICHIASLAAFLIIGCNPFVNAEEHQALGEQVIRDTKPLPGAAAIMLSYADVIENVRDSVVTVFVTLPPPPRQDQIKNDPESFDLRPKEEPSPDEGEKPASSGSGLIITSGGLIVTNAHVVIDALRVSVRLRAHEVDIPAAVVGVDRATDIALLKIESPGLKPATLGDSAISRPGDVVLAMGSPFGLEQTITQGIISATGRGALGILQGGMEDFIQTDAAINPGNSGGPLMDGKGRVVGINTARFRGENIGFAVPVNLVLKIASDLLDHGWVVRGHLGVQAQEATAELLAQLQLPKNLKGVVIAGVETDQPAARAGFLPGDFVLEVNGRRVENVARFRLSLAGSQPGTIATFKVNRRGQSLELKATLAEPPEHITARKSQEAKASAGETTVEWVPGLVVAEVSQEWRVKFRLPPLMSGLIVTQPYVVAGGTLHLEPGDQILSINGSVVRTLTEARRRLEQVKTGVLLLKINRAGREKLVAVPRNG